MPLQIHIRLLPNEESIEFMALDFQKLSKDDREEIRACMGQENASKKKSTALNSQILIFQKRNFEKFNGKKEFIAFHEDLNKDPSNVKCRN